MDINIFNNTQIKDLLRENDVANLSLFGSSARYQDNSTSDIDLIVRFNKKKSLLAFVRLERELSNVLGKKVDLVTENSISPYLKNIINNEATIVYDEQK